MNAIVKSKTSATSTLKPMKQVIVVRWEESEAGWGTRPDGYSLHKDDAAARQFIQDYWAKMPKQVPEEYSRPLGQYIGEVTDAVYESVCESGTGVRSFKRDYPPQLGQPKGNFVLTDISE